MNQEGVSARYIRHPEYGLSLIVDGDYETVGRVFWHVTEHFRVCIDCGDQIKVVGDGYIHLGDTGHADVGVDTTYTKVDEGKVVKVRIPKLQRKYKERTSLEMVTTIGEIVKKYKELMNG